MLTSASTVKLKLDIEHLTQGTSNCVGVIPVWIWLKCDMHNTGILISYGHDLKIKC